jgi:hypothetical protein
MQNFSVKCACFAFVYMCLNVNAKGEKGIYANSEKYRSFSVNWVRRGGSIKT